MADTSTGRAMYLLYCDETNFQKLSGDFFVYGGIIIDGAKAGKYREKYLALRDFLQAQGIEIEQVL
ncbi:DUF3800 domain-containing protein [Burkholderia thailandensis]|uniref:DUF3800 domain-containing protein n=1 Tax=Burkholderia thailandensis TaxID=57975 RepID=UPI001F3517B4|nr:DUF3800 domain-containing protein [Burkholderia thailandensis]